MSKTDSCLIAGKSNQVATVWDLNYVAQTEDWSLQVLDNDELSSLV